MAPICIDPSRIFPAGDILNYILIGPFDLRTLITLPPSGLGDRILPPSGTLSLIGVCNFELPLPHVFTIDRYLFFSIYLSLYL
jgi:hypothetical protein